MLDQQKYCERRGAILSASHKIGIRHGLRGVPGTRFLANVTTKRVSGERQILGEWAAMFDRRIANAEFRGDGPIGKDGMGGTSIDAPRARATTIGDRGRGDIVFQRR